MGLNIGDNKRVAFDDTHQQRVDTSLEKNPSRGQVGDLDLRFVFRRNKTGDLDRDGNPLIYALKGMNGYSIAPMYRQMFFRRAKEIVEKMSHEIDAEYVIPVPSSYAFCREFAEVLAEWLNLKLLVSDPKVVE